jgi:hypothetical protein
MLQRRATHKSLHCILLLFVAATVPTVTRAQPSVG